MGAAKPSCNYRWNDAMIGDFDAFYFTVPVQKFFSPDLLKKLLNSGKIVVFSNMTSTLVSNYISSGEYEETGGDKPPGRLEVSGKKIFYYIYAQQKYAKKRYNLTDAESAAEFVKGKLYPAIKSAGL